jgi:hypothetical protein
MFYFDPPKIVKAAAKLSKGLYKSENVSTAIAEPPVIGDTASETAGSEIASRAKTGEVTQPTTEVYETSFVEATFPIDNNSNCNDDNNTSETQEDLRQRDQVRSRAGKAWVGVPAVQREVKLCSSVTPASELYEEIRQLSPTVTRNYASVLPKNDTLIAETDNDEYPIKGLKPTSLKRAASTVLLSTPSHERLNMDISTGEKRLAERRKYLENKRNSRQAQKQAADAAKVRICWI